MYAMPNLLLPKQNDSDRPLMSQPFSQDSTLLILLTAEALFTSALLALIGAVVSKSSIDVAAARYLHKTSSKASVYIGLQVVAIIAWVIFAGLSGAHLVTAEPGSGVMLCRLRVQRLGNLQRSTLQCRDAGYAIMVAAVLANLGLCVTVIVIKIIQLIYIFGVQQSGETKKVAHLLFEAGVIENTKEIGPTYSDLQFALMTGNTEVLTALKSKSEMSLKEL